MRLRGITITMWAAALVAPAAASAQGAGDERAVQLSPKQARFAPGTPERARRGHYPKGPARIGTRRTWLAVDWAARDPNGFTVEYLKDFTLRGMGEHVEVWVSEDVAYPEGDCRNRGDLLEVKPKHVEAIVRAFDERIWPRATAAFFAPGLRDGSNAGLPALLPGMPSDAYRGEGDNIVILLDNIRDERFYGTGTGGTAGYVVGYWKELYFDRHVMTVDLAGLDHLLGPAPEPAPRDGCVNVVPKPEFVESIVAHEYMHLLEDERDSLGAERPWLLEGLADAGARAVGYPAGIDMHVDCFLGRLRETGCTPESSISAWRDPGVAPGSQYGAAATLVESLPGGALKALMEDPAHGLESVSAFTGRAAADDVSDWTAGVAAAVNWDLPQRLDGAPANGADYVRLPLGGVRFDGDETALVRTGWDRDEDTWTTRPGDDLDSTMVREVKVPADDPVLRLDTRYDLEPGYDFGFVQVSADGGRTWRSVPGRGTTSETAEFPDPRVVENLPGLTGASGGWVEEEYDLSAYAGQTVRVALRYVTDRFFESVGWSVRDVRLGGAILDGWEPPARGDLRLLLVGLDAQDAVTGSLRVPLDRELRGAVSGLAVRAAVGPAARSLGAVVTFVEPMEQHVAPARYVLEPAE